MKRGFIFAGVLVLAPMAALAKDSPGNEKKSEPQRSSRRHGGQAPRGITGEDAIIGQRAGRSGDSGPMGPGIELGEADGMAGGRTDRGPKGEVGIGEYHSTPKESRERANEDNQSRHGGVNRTQAAPQRADYEGGGPGTHDLNYAEPLREEGPRIHEKTTGHSPAQADTDQPGGAATEGTAGPSEDAQGRGSTSKSK